MTKSLSNDQYKIRTHFSEFFPSSAIYCGAYDHDGKIYTSIPSIYGISDYIFYRSTMLEFPAFSPNVQRFRHFQLLVLTPIIHGLLTIPVSLFRIFKLIPIYYALTSDDFSTFSYRYLRNLIRLVVRPLNILMMCLSNLIGLVMPMYGARMYGAWEALEVGAPVNPNDYKRKPLQNLLFNLSDIGSPHYFLGMCMQPCKKIETNLLAQLPHCTPQYPLGKNPKGWLFTQLLILNLIENNVIELNGNDKEDVISRLGKTIQYLKDIHKSVYPDTDNHDQPWPCQLDNSSPFLWLIQQICIAYVFPITSLSCRDLNHEIFLKASEQPNKRLIQTLFEKLEKLEKNQEQNTCSL